MATGALHMPSLDRLSLDRDGLLMNQVWSPVFLVLKHSILPERPISMHINV